MDGIHDAPDALERRHLQGSSWFFAVAALALVTSAVDLTAGERGFAFGLGFTGMMDSIALGLSEELGGAIRLTVFGFDLIVASGIAAIGLLARGRHLWAYWVGMFLYALDGSLLLLVGDWTAVAVHGFVLVCLWGGMRACGELRARAAAFAAPSVEAA